MELRPQLRTGELSSLLNMVVQSVQEKKIRVTAIDSFRAISDVAPSRGDIWRFLGELSQQLINRDCIGLLLGEYSIPRDLDLPEFAMADVIIHLEVDRQVGSDVRTLRILKLRGGAYLEGRSAFT